MEPKRDALLHSQFSTHSFRAIPRALAKVSTIGVQFRSIVVAIGQDFPFHLPCPLMQLTKPSSGWCLCMCHTTDEERFLRPRKARIIKDTVRVIYDPCIPSCVLFIICIKHQ